MDTRTDLGLTAGEVRLRAGITHRRLDYWIGAGLLRPSMANPTGTGNRRRFSEVDVVAARTLGRLRDLGAPLRALGAVQDALRIAGNAKHLYVAPDGSTAFDPALAATWDAFWAVRLDEAPALRSVAVA